MDEEDDIEEFWREPDPVVIVPPKFDVTVGSKVVACNTGKLNRDENAAVFDAEHFYEEGEVINVHDEYICDVKFPSGDILYNAKINSFK